MHELSLAESILQIIEKAAIEQQFKRVNTVWLEIGQLTCVEQEALRFFFDIVTQDSIAQSARLEINEIAGEGWCNQCQSSVPLAALYDSCPNCGNYALKLTCGDVMQIKELEVE